MVAEISQPQQGADTAQRGASPVRALMLRFDICTWLVLVGLALDIFAVVLQLLFLHRLHGLLDMYGYGHIPRDQIPDGKGVDNLTRLFGLSGIVIVLAALFTAMGRARRIAVEVGVTDYENSFGWTVGSLFIPIISLYQPWAGLAEIRKSIFFSAREGRTGDSWNAAKGISFATLVMAGLLFSSNLGELVYALATKPSVGHGAVDFGNWLTAYTSREVTIIVIRLLKGVPIFLYLLTLRGPLLKLASLPPAPALPAISIPATEAAVTSGL